MSLPVYLSKLLFFHSCGTRVALVFHMSQSCCTCVTFVAFVLLVSLVSGTRVAN